MDDELVLDPKDLPVVISNIRLFDHIQDSRKRTFLETFAKSGILAETCKMTAILPRNHYYWLEHDEEYREAYNIANDMATDLLEQEATRRAMNGSDLLLIFLLKARKPHIFREQKVVIGGNVQHEMRITVVRTDSPKNYLTAPQTPGSADDS